MNVKAVFVGEKHLMLMCSDGVSCLSFSLIELIDQLRIEGWLVAIQYALYNMRYIVCAIQYALKGLYLILVFFISTLFADQCTTKRQLVHVYIT